MTHTAAGWLCYLMLSRDLKSFSRAVSRLRSKGAKLEFVAGSEKTGSSQGGGAGAHPVEDPVQQQLDFAGDVAPFSRGVAPFDDLPGNTMMLLRPTRRANNTLPCSRSIRAAGAHLQTTICSAARCADASNPPLPCHIVFSVIRQVHIGLC